MKIVRLLTLCLTLIVTVYSCTKDRNLPVPNASADHDHSLAGKLVINEFMASGSTYKNEFNFNSDWIEIRNTTDETFLLKQGEWFITDSIQSPEKFQLPEVIISPKGYLLIWCDDANTVVKQIHSNFKLSSGGEDIALYYKHNGKLVQSDAYSYGSQTSGCSLARVPDGSGSWTSSIHPSPGQLNRK